MMTRFALLTLACAAVPMTAMAQAPAQLDEAAATRQLTDWGFTEIRLDDRERDHFEFEARDADGRRVDIDLGFNGTVLQLDVDGDARASNANLASMLPEAVQAAATANGIIDVQEFDTNRTDYSLEGFDAQNRKIEISVPRA